MARSKKLDGKTDAECAKTGNASDREEQCCSSEGKDKKQATGAHGCGCC